VARFIPAAGYDLTHYSQDLEGQEEVRGLPYYRIGLEGPRPYRIWDVREGGRIERLKHLIEPRISYVFTPTVEQDDLPQFDSLDRITRKAGCSLATPVRKGRGISPRWPGWCGGGRENAAPDAPDAPDA
jgi:hypothetical protein